MNDQPKSSELVKLMTIKPGDSITIERTFFGGWIVHAPGGIGTVNARAAFTTVDDLLEYMKKSLYMSAGEHS